MISFDDISYQWETVDGERNRLVIIIKIPPLTQDKKVREFLDGAIQNCFNNVI